MKVKTEIFRSEVTGDIYKLREYDERGNLVHFKDVTKGYEEWREYDSNNNLLKYTDNKGYVVSHKYDDNGVKIHDDIYEYEFHPGEEVKVEKKYEKLLLPMTIAGISSIIGAVIATVITLLVS